MGISAACFGCCLIFITTAPDLTLFVIAAFFFGAAKGALDLGINAQAVIVEKTYGRPIMSSFQAVWSVGGLGGGLLPSAALKEGFNRDYQLRLHRIAHSADQPDLLPSPFISSNQ